MNTWRWYERAFFIMAGLMYIAVIIYIIAHINL